MCNPMLIYAGFQVAAGGYKAYSQYKAGVAQKKYYDYMSEQSRSEGEYAMRIGQKQSEVIQDVGKERGKEQEIKSTRLASSQRAALVANGVDLSSVTADDISNESFGRAKLDEMAIRYNADVKSWETMTDARYRKYAADTQADQYSYAGENALYSAKVGAFSTLLGTAASVAGSYAFKGLTPAKSGSTGIGGGTNSMTSFGGRSSYLPLSSRDTKPFGVKFGRSIYNYN